MPAPIRRSLLVFAALAACQSKLSTEVDTVLQQRISTLQDCFPGLYRRVNAVIDILQAWRLDNGTNAASDPSGLTWSEQGDGRITLSYVVAGSTIAMTIRFYSPTGTQQNLNLTGATTLNDAFDVAATQLAANFPTGTCFAVGDWSISGGGLSGTGAVTGLFGGASNRRITSLSTTTATPSGGPPPAATGTVNDSGPPNCTLTFATTDLQIDVGPTVVYPTGSIPMTLVATGSSYTTVAAVVTFDGTSTANIVVTGIAGSFDYDVVSRTLTYVQ